MLHRLLNKLTIGNYVMNICKIYFVGVCNLKKKQHYLLYEYAFGMKM